MTSFSYLQRSLLSHRIKRDGIVLELSDIIKRDGIVFWEYHIK